MKTNVEINGYVISIEEENGVISVNATKDDEVVEEFTLQTEEGEDFEGEDFEGEEDAEEEDVKTFGDYEEEEDFEGEDDDEFEGEDDDDDDDDEFEAEEEDDDDFEEMPKKGNDMALESFQSFINKKRK